MGNMTARQAIQVVALQAIHMACVDGGGCPQWEDFPEIGEGDWLDVLAEIDRETPAQPAYFTAYDILEARANNDDF